VLWLVIALSCLGSSSTTRALDVSPWERVLARHARSGGVDYSALAADRSARADLQRFVESLATMPESEPLGVWLDAYNALVVDSIVQRWPLESVRRDPGFFDRARFEVAGRMRSLDDVEHRVIRARFPDARVHAALVCGARSCPPLHPHALGSGDLDATLARLSRDWVRSDRHVRVEGDVVRASAIFAWYRADFERDAGSVLGWIRRHAGDRAIPAGARVVELPYDWAINTP
jgi:hypothetical protein